MSHFSLIKIRGQSTLEYLVFVLFMVAAFTVMQVYARRAISGRIRDGADGIARSYEQGQTSSSLKTTLTGIRETDVVGWRYDPEDDSTWPINPLTGEPILGIENGEYVTTEYTAYGEKLQRSGGEAVAGHGDSSLF